MKTYLGLPSLMLLASVTFAADVAQPCLRVNHHETGCQLQWTNSVCPARPIHEVVGAPTPTGPWSHIAWVTNVTSFALPNTNQAGFYRLAWTGDDNWSLEMKIYDYDVMPAVPPYATHLQATGSISLVFNGQRVSAPYSYWDFDIDPGCYFCPTNPVTGTYYGSRDESNCTVTLTEGTTVLHGWYRTVTNSAGCLVNEIQGRVSVGGFAGFFDTGTWSATSKQ